MKKLTGFLLLSLLLHIALYASSLFSWKTLVPKKSPQVIEIDLEKRPPEVSASASAPRPSKKTAKASRPAAIPPPDLVQKFLSQGPSLNPSHDEGKASHTLREGTWDENGYTTNDNPNVAWGAGAGTFERIQDLGFMQFLHRKIDGILFYPEVLARHKISGTVNTRIVFNKEGSCDWHNTKIQAGDPYLRVFVLHILKKVCGENFKHYLKNRTQTSVDMSFQFLISEHTSEQEYIDEHQKIVGNVLLFFRNSQQSVAQWHLGPFTGVFPIPWVSLDFGWIMENFDKYVDHEDPMGDFKDGKAEEAPAEAAH